MRLTPRYWHLADFKLSQKLTRNELKYMSTHLVMTHFKKGAKLELNNGETGDVYFLKKGTAKIITDNDSGEEEIKYLIKRGDIFGILNVMDGENENDSAVAIEDSLICTVDSVTLKGLMVENTKLNNHLFKLAGLRIQKLERRLEALVYKNAETRVKEFITEYVRDFGEESGAELVVKNMLSNKDIGKLTSTSRQTVNKVLNDLKDNGYLHFDKNVMLIARKNLI